MPRAKGKKNGRRAVDSRQPSDEEYDTGDNASYISTDSTDVQSISGAAEGGADEIDEISAQEMLEDKLKDVIDGLTQKSAKGRTDALLSLRRAFTKKYVFEFIFDRKVTVLDCLERCLKKGKGEEQAHAAICAVLLVLQLGLGQESEAIFIELRPILTTLLTDKTASTKARTACAEALGLLAFLAECESDVAQEVMRVLEAIFSTSYLKGDHTPPTHSPEVYALHTAALHSWALLLSVASDTTVQILIHSHLPRLEGLLQSPDVDVRITCGETLALVYEVARDLDENFEGQNDDCLCNTLKQLATDSNKHRAKKDRRLQRSSFREVLRAIEDGDMPCYRVQFGVESVSIDCWTRKRHYDSLCHILTIGMNMHLMENDLVRDIFQLGAPVPVGLEASKRPSRNERHMFNALAFKARTKVRSKLRDKRTVATHMAYS